MIGGTGRIGRHVTARLALGPHEIAVCHRGRTAAELPSRVLHFASTGANLPLIFYPDAAIQWRPTILIHMICMGDPDAAACVATFGSVARRCVLVSSGDVYAAYGRFLRLESGIPDPTPQAEDATLRSVLFPYRAGAAAGSLEYWYEKQLAERSIAGGEWEWVILRLPKVYGPGINEDLASIYDHAGQPHWRWTHDHVVNVGAAIALAALHPAAARRTYNVGEAVTPTMGERLARLPPRAGQKSGVPMVDRDYSHDLVLDTRRIRNELGFRDEVPETSACEV